MQAASGEDSGWGEGGSSDAPAPSFTNLAGASKAMPPADATAPRPARSHSTTPPRVLVVGGSMAGSCTAIALHSVGCSVAVFERSRELRSQGAGLVIQPDMAAFLLRYGVAKLDELCVKSAGRQYIDRDGQVVGGDSCPQLFCAWDVLFRALKEAVPTGIYHSGAKVKEVAADEQGVSVVLEGGERHSGDLLVGADGPGSIVRAHFCPGVRSHYQGYVAWRGLVPEGEAPAVVVEFIANKFTVYQAHNFHFLCYCIPGEAGEVQPGQRRINWVWYWNTTQGELPELLRDASGAQHGYSVPRGLLRPEVAAERQRVAREVLPPQMAQLVEATQDIFLQAIQDLLAPSLAFGDRVCITGDAACILRPHTAAGTTKAAVNAATLASTLQHHGFSLPEALAAYNDSQLELARYLVGVGVRIGTRSQFPEGNTGDATQGRAVGHTGDATQGRAVGHTGDVTQGRAVGHTGDATQGRD